MDLSKHLAPTHPPIASTRSGVAWLIPALDELDYGIVVLIEGMRIVHMNRAARDEFDAHHPLEVRGDQLHARHEADAGPWREALDSVAARGLRRFLTLGTAQHRVSMSAVPLSSPAAPSPATLVLLGKRRVCQALSVEAYARAHGLTSAETRVLVHLCRGEAPARTAQMLGVALSTVRTQIGKIRLKTGARSIRALLGDVAILPPMVSVLGMRAT